MSAWTDIVDAHDREVDRVASALSEVLRCRRGKLAPWYAGSGGPEDKVLKVLCKDVAARAIGIIAETPNGPVGPIAQHVREEARRLARKPNEAFLAEWATVREAHSDPVKISLVRDVQHTAWRLGIPLDDLSSPNSYATDLRAALSRVAAGDVILDAPPGAAAPPQRKGRPPNLRAELTAELVVCLYVQVTGREPSITHGEAGRLSVQRFAPAVCRPLGLPTPGRRIMDVAIAAALVNAAGSAARQAMRRGDTRSLAPSAIMRLVRR